MSSVRDLVRGLRRAEPGRRERAAGRYRRPLPRAGHHPPHRTGSRRRGLERRRVQGDGDRLRRRPRRPPRTTRRGSPPGTICSQEGVEVITPNPLTSGGARWNIMAAYGAQLEQGKTEEEAIEYLRQLFAHVPVLDKSARESLATFAGGKGDVLHRLRERGHHRPAEGRAARVRRSRSDDPHREPRRRRHRIGQSGEGRRAFIDFLRTPEAQRDLRREGLPLDPAGGPGGVRLPRRRRVSSPSPTTAAGPR